MENHTLFGEKNYFIWKLSSVILQTVNLVGPNYNYYGKNRCIYPWRYDIKAVIVYIHGLSKLTGLPLKYRLMYI